MYEAYFRLKEKPFSISPDPRFIYLTAQHQEALAKVQYAISQRMGVSAIYGDIGAGKTSWHAGCGYSMQMIQPTISP